MVPQQAPTAPGGSTQDEEMVPIDLGPSEQIAAPAMDEPEMGWCRIVEEPQDD